MTMQKISRLAITYHAFARDGAVQSKFVLSTVITLHLLAIIYLLEKANPPLKKPVQLQPMLVALISPAAKAPVLVSPVAVPKPNIQPKPKLKKIVESVKPIEQAIEIPIEGTSKQDNEDISTPSMPIQAAQAETEEKMLPKTEPAVVEKTEPPKFGVAYMNNPEPVYPSLSRRRGEEGRVLLRVLVSEEGAATQVSLEKTSGWEQLDEAAIEAVRQWRFIPARKGGQNLSAYVLVPIKFSLNS